MSEKKRSEPEWLDLEDDIEDTEYKNYGEYMEEEEWEEEDLEAKHPPRKSASRHQSSKKKKKSGVNFHAVLLCLIALLFVVIAFKLLFWDKREHQNTERENDTTLSFETEALDYIIPLDASNPVKKEKDDDLRILFLGNGSLAEDKTSDTNLANIVQKKSGATVYNCAIPGTYMSMKNELYEERYPYDALSFYFLCTIFTFGNTQTLSAADADMGGLPKEVKEATDLLQSIDTSELDIICIYYDAADYLEQRPIIDFYNETNPTTFCGALTAGIKLIQELLPNSRIIVMSPTYAYAVDKNGNYSSSFETDVLEDSLATYIGMESQSCMGSNVSFVDNFYGSIYEELAPDYLKDNILLNEKGHALLADRFLDALNRFHDYDF